MQAVDPDKNALRMVKCNSSTLIWNTERGTWHATPSLIPER